MSDDTTETADVDDTSAYVGEYDKLVRDDIPAVVRDDGNRPVTRRVDGAEYETYLAAKLREEAIEYADALDSDEGVAGEREDPVDELADVYAVLDAIVTASETSMPETSMDDVRARAREKARERGGFDDGVVLERIEPGPD